MKNPADVHSQQNAYNVFCTWSIAIQIRGSITSEHITSGYEKFCAVHRHVIYASLVFPEAALSAKVTQRHCNDFIRVMGLSRHGRSLTALGSLLYILSTVTMNILPATIWKQRMQNSTALGGRTIRKCSRSLCISNINVLFTLLDSKYGSRKHNLSIYYENFFCGLSFRIVQVP